MKKLVLFLLILCVVGCSSSKPSNFYNLISTTGVDNKIKNSRKITIGIKVVNIPSYLTKPQIITLKNTTEFNLAETHRWLEPLQYSIQRVVAENIGKYVDNSMVKPVSFESEDFDYNVQIEINKFYGNMNGYVELSGFYSIKNRNNSLSTRAINIKKNFKAIENNDYSKLVMYYSEIVDELSKEIASKIVR